MTLQSCTSPGQPAIDHAAVLERIWLELGALGLDVERLDAAIAFRRSEATIWTSDGFRALAQSGRVTVSTDPEGRHGLRADLSVSWIGVAYMVVGFGLPRYFARQEWQGLLDGWRDRYLAANAA